MKAFTFIITALTLYPILGTIFFIFLGFFKSENEKLKITILTFLHPLIHTIILWFIFPNVFLNSLIWPVFYLLLILVKEIAFSNRKYLSKLIVTNEGVSIEYINCILKRKSIDIPITRIKDFGLSSMKSIWDYPATLKYNYDVDNHLKFIIINKKTWILVSEVLNTAQLLIE